MIPANIKAMKHGLKKIVEKKKTEKEVIEEKEKEKQKENEETAAIVLGERLLNQHRR